eukprot:TRINITY_DN31733_c0_g1_i1.p1 TRINITY_DN31733_c0_g1~~TRINITY_DN31733_c0_g1_i1.p1  ORF type:complete len:152 (+),score=3.39 TRINITY_DN31733_c0_g1_i1:1222-1677(+)
MFQPLTMSGASQERLLGYFIEYIGYPTNLYLTLQQVYLIIGWIMLQSVIGMARRIAEQELFRAYGIECTEDYDIPFLDIEITEYFFYNIFDEDGPLKDTLLSNLPQLYKLLEVLLIIIKRNTVYPMLGTKLLSLKQELVTNWKQLGLNQQQ